MIMNQIGYLYLSKIGLTTPTTTIQRTDFYIQFSICFGAINFALLNMHKISFLYSEVNENQEIPLVWSKKRTIKFSQPNQKFVINDVRMPYIKDGVYRVSMFVSDENDQLITTSSTLINVS
ncbi:hypothetical protein [Convivina praedatoris]|uniref:Uncharacterized protein n=1 Tax=Convivina praedatoris TaxID=2880963 RepID=A0ABM9D3R7_9LACO|nr:hypothetical protein [Convivina sp. LMG 32447]CAH1854492.1 hypothetical protein R077815_01059 [Convivina sp. LMG 32447]CAH1855702.1 hypothetical protein R078138_01194 [Convivina sp. LMG 32447]CAH1855828.1 hypothetical protein LMG032447_01173 [Convivina sp. LMG 32447]